MALNATMEKSNDVFRHSGFNYHATMSMLASALSEALPAPVYTGEHETAAGSARNGAPRVVDGRSIDLNQLTLKVIFCCPYTLIR